MYIPKLFTNIIILGAAYCQASNCLIEIFQLAVPLANAVRCKQMNTRSVKLRFDVLKAQV